MARFFRRGISKVKWVPTIAATSGGIVGSPTTAEITAGTDLTPQIAEINGFQFTNSPISVPDLVTTFTTQIGGEDTVSDSSITLYDDNASTTIRTAIAKGTSGNAVLMPYGAVAAKRIEIYPAFSTGPNDEWSTDNVAARYTCGFAITGQPNQNGVHP